MEFRELIKDESAYEEYCSNADVDGDALLVYVEGVGDVGDTVDELIEAFCEAYQGTHRDMGDFAQDLVENVLGLDFSKLEWPMTCIDWEQAGSELRYDYWYDDTRFGGIYVFRNI